MKLIRYTAPVLEPVTLSELKLHLRLDSGSFASNIDTTQSILPGSHAVADNYTTHVGAGVNVLGYTAIVNLNAGTVGASGTVDAKIQESDDNITYTDWATGAFTQVTSANDNDTQEKAYTGTKAYIRTVAKVLVAACEFGTEVIRLNPTTSEDDRLNDIITAARESIEDITRRALLTQVWDLYLDEWPDEDYIELPFGNLQNTAGVEPAISWKDTDGTETTLTVTTDYLVETNGDDKGRIVLPYGGSWPSDTLYPSNPIKIRFTCGWTAAASVPKQIKNAVLLKAENIYLHGDDDATLNKAINSLLSSQRLW